MTTRFLCRVGEDGTLVALHPERLARWRGKEVWISVHEQPTIGLRSDSGNRYLWGVVYRAISEETGNDPETIHLALKREAVRVGVLDPQYVVLGDKLIEDEPTTRTDADTFQRYIHWIKDWALTELRLVIPEGE